MAPFQYVSSLPSKKVRHHAIDALNIWFSVPEADLTMIKDAIDQLHNASLMYVLLGQKNSAQANFVLGSMISRMTRHCAEGIQART